MKKLLSILLAAFILSGCASSVVKVGPGDTVVANKVALQVDGAWNQVTTYEGNPWTVWTNDGLALDELRFWVGVRDGEPIALTGKDQRPLHFKASMQPHEMVALFSGLFTRDGSVFTLDKLEPVDFLGSKGFRFQFTLVRQSDDVTLTGVAWVAVRDNALHAMTFTAPRLGFFPRHAARVEQIARSARLKS